ncbi:MAG TPA: ABC transporter permease [Chloroflexota bacterium]|nr:ABC transporter permease [Chloroflexota bacterium]
MSRYLAGRLVVMIPTIVVLSLVLFVLMRLTPGSPLQPIAPNANPLSPEAQEALAKEWGLDKPIIEQYLVYVWKAFQLDFGMSYLYKTRSVTEILGPTLPVSLHLGLMALTIAIVVGVTLGVLAATHRNGGFDYLCTFIAMIGVSVPNFVMAIVFIIVFVMGLKVIPYTGGWESPVDWIMPTLVLSLAPLAIIARYTRSSMIEAISSDYVRTARAKGNSERRVMLYHVLKNALIPPLTIMGPLVAAVATGSPFVEIIFRVPGMGRYFIESVLARDYPVIMAVFLFYGVFLQAMNLVVDVLYGIVDPRIRLDG